MCWAVLCFNHINEINLKLLIVVTEKKDGDEECSIVDNSKGHISLRALHTGWLAGRSQVIQYGFSLDFVSIYKLSPSIWTFYLSQSTDLIFK